RARPPERRRLSIAQPYAFNLTTVQNVGHTVGWCAAPGVCRWPQRAVAQHRRGPTAAGCLLRAELRDRTGVRVEAVGALASLCRSTAASPSRGRKCSSGPTSIAFAIL